MSDLNIKVTEKQLIETLNSLNDQFYSLTQRNIKSVQLVDGSLFFFDVGKVYAEIPNYNDNKGDKKY